MKASKEIKIVIKTDYSPTPGPRYISEGDYSGEDFRKKILVPKLKEAIKAQCKLIICLDGVAGYGSSFLEEAFGGLIRHEKYNYEQLRQIIQIISIEEPYLSGDIDRNMKEANSEE